MKIDGKQIAAEILDTLKVRVNKLKDKGITPHLHILLLSDDPSSASYVKQKLLRGGEVGVRISLEKLNPQIDNHSLIKRIGGLNMDNSVHGIIIQRPMPKHLDEGKIEKAVNPEKDIDGFNPVSKFKTPVALAVLEALGRINSQEPKTKGQQPNFVEWLKSKKITIIGKGLTAGGPIIRTLKNMGINPNIITSKTDNRDYLFINSDIIISAVGKPGIINSSMVKNGVILIGVGMHREEDTKFHGDFKENDIQDKASFYTPTPGGIGPINVAMLLKNLVQACEEMVN